MARSTAGGELALVDPVVERAGPVLALVEGLAVDLGVQTHSPDLVLQLRQSACSDTSNGPVSVEVTWTGAQGLGQPLRP
ncbi:MAG: hypothetical protein M3133_02605 [Actinomycetota bacterium]|nr:hypothetical protein [Actinomycetota bacterium]